MKTPPPCCGRTAGVRQAAASRSAHSGARAGAPRWGNAESSGVSVAARQYGCGNAVAGAIGHCWTLGGDVRTETGALSGWLSSTLTGCFGDVVWIPGRLGVARNRAAGVYFPHFPGDFLSCRGDGMREKPRRIPQHYGATHCRQREY